jgi:zinc protease
MFEHLMYDGSERVRPGGHDEHIRAVGGYSNALTTEDGTAYHDTVPRDHLDLALQLEAERMRGLLFRSPAIKQERKRIKAEIQRNLKSPLYAGVIGLLEAAFAGHPYAWTSAGVIADVDKIGAADLEKFYGRYYRPNNALLVIAGDVDETVAKQKVAKHFSGIERGPEPEAVAEPRPLPGGKRVTGSPGRLGLVFAAYRIPGAASPDIYPLQLLSLILSRGTESRLYKKLVGSKLAVEAGGQAIIRSQPGLFMVFGAFSDPTRAVPLERALVAEIDRIASGGVTAAELERAKNQARAAIGFALQGSDGIARQVGTAWLATGKPASYRDGYTKISEVTAADIARVSKAYLSADKRLTMLIPLAGGER